MLKVYKERNYKVIGFSLIFISLLQICKGMEIIVFIVGSILAFLSLTNDITTKLSRWGLSIISAYGFFKFFFHNVHIWKISDYNEPENWVMFSTSQYVWWSILFFVISYLIFHKLLRLFFINIIVNPLEKINKNIFSQLPISYYRMIQVSVIKKLRKIIRKHKKRGIIKKAKKEEQITNHYFTESIYTASEFSAQIIFCWFVLNIYSGTPIIVSFIIVAAFILFAILSLSAVNLVGEFVLKLIEHEYKLINKEIVK